MAGGPGGGPALSDRRSIRAASWVLAALTLGAALPPGDAHGTGPDLGRPTYVEVTAAAGLGGFFHAGSLGEEDGAAPPLFPEITGSGACWLDADGDGALDLFLVNGLYLRDWNVNQALDPRSKLYRNLGDGTFQDVATATGTDLFSVGQGCTAGDYDNDGDPDLAVIQYGGNVLLRNDGGTFTNVTQDAGLRAEFCGSFKCWGSSASWWDYDRDGCLDLFVDRFGDYDLADPPQGNGPEQAPGQKNALFRGDCAGHFADRAEAAGMVEASNSWGSVSGDFVEDGWPDLFVANDGDLDDLYVNRGDGTFDRLTFDPRHGMGIAHGDANLDGHLDVAITNYVGEENSILMGDGQGGFVDLGRDPPFTDAHDWSGWAAHWFDAQNDGRPELMVLNGMTEAVPFFHLEEPVLFYENGGPAGWSVLRDDVGPDLQRDFVARGGAWGDYDDDGDVDVLVAEAGPRPTHLLRADGTAGNFLNLDLVGTAPGVTRDAVGAQVRVRAAGLAEQLQEKVLGSGFLSSNDPRLHFGLARAARADVEVRWPDGSTQAWTGLRANTFQRLTQGQAQGEVLRTLPFVTVEAPAAGPRLGAVPFAAAVEVPEGAGPVAVRWDFGDGGTAEGAAVSHAFREVGTFTVRATATDALGRAKTQAAQLRVVDTLHATVSFDHAVFYPWEAVNGTVRVRYSNGDPVDGAEVAVAVTYASGVGELDAFMANQPRTLREALGYKDQSAAGSTAASGELRIGMGPTVGQGEVQSPFTHPGTYTATARGGLRGFTFEPAVQAYQVGVRLPAAP